MNISINYNNLKNPNSNTKYNNTNKIEQKNKKSSKMNDKIFL